MDTTDPIEVLEALCELLLVDMDGLARQLKPKHSAEQEKIKSGQNLSTFLAWMLSADAPNGPLSIRQVMLAISHAAHEDYYEVHGYFRTDNGRGPRQLLGTVKFRAPDGSTAGVQARDRLWQASLEPVNAWAYDANPAAVVPPLTGYEEIIRS